MKELRDVLLDFHNLTKFKIVLYDADRRVLYSYPENMCDFCRKVRSYPDLTQKCLHCDNIGFDICDETKSPHIYTCHMSVTEAIAPIYSNEILVGYLMFGQIRKPEQEKIAPEAREAAQLCGATDEMFRQMPAAEDDYIRSAANMMRMCASYLCTKEIIRRNPNVLSYHLEQYITTHLDGELSVEELCRRFYISRAKLYQLSLQNFQMGISDYIRMRRLKRARRLLLDTDFSVSRIASMVGIPDTNYFIRNFKRNYGLTPLQYRKRNR